MLVSFFGWVLSWGIKYSICRIYSSEPRAEVYCLQLNFKISKLAYSTYIPTLESNDRT